RAGAAPDDVLHHRDAHHRELQGLRPDPGDDQRRAGHLHPGAVPVHLPQGLRGARLRLRLRSGDRAVLDLHRGHRGAVPHQQEEGPLMATLSLDRRPAQTARARRRTVGRTVLYVVMIAAAVAIMVPFVWMVISSLKTNNQVFTIPIQWIP